MLGETTKEANSGGASSFPTSTPGTLRRATSMGGGLIDQLASSPYGQPVADALTRVMTAAPGMDRSSLVWKDFTSAVRRRHDMVQKLIVVAGDSATPIGLLRRALLDLRQTSLTLIEDALELEYRSRLSHRQQDSLKPTKKTLQSTLNSTTSKTNDTILKENQMNFISEILSQMIDDVQPLFQISNIRVMLPLGFPSTRNPFLLGKTVDDLSSLQPPTPEAGNMEEELRVLELLRYRRASVALLRAETVIQNRLPIELHRLESWILHMKDDLRIDRVLRLVCTILDNDLLVSGENLEIGGPSDESDFTCLTDPNFSVEGFRLLRRLNSYRGDSPLRVDLQIALRQSLRDLDLSGLLDEPVGHFMCEWLQLAVKRQGGELILPTHAAQLAISEAQKASEVNEAAAAAAMAVAAAEAAKAAAVAAAESVLEARWSMRNSGGTPLISSRSTPRLGSATGRVTSRSINSTSGANSHPTTAEGTRRIGTATETLHEASVEDDVASVVGPEDYQRTHEKIFEHQKSRKKMQQKEILGNQHNPPGSSSAKRAPSRAKTPAASASVPSSTVLPTTLATNSTVDGGSKADTTGVSIDVNSPAFAAAISAAIANSTVASTTNAAGIPNDSVADVGASGAVLKRKIRSEVERVIRELGILSRFEEDGPSQSETVTSLRYELNRLQQELLRRQVLDPRQFEYLSVDDVAINQRLVELNRLLPSGTTKKGASSSPTKGGSPIRSKEDKATSQIGFDPSAGSSMTARFGIESTLLPLSNQSIPFNFPISENEMIALQITFNIISDVHGRRLLCSASMPFSDAINCRLVDSPPVLLDGMGDRPYEVFGFPLSCLMYNRLTGYTYKQLAEARKYTRPKLLEKVMESLKLCLNEVPTPLGMITARIDRTLFTTQVTEDHVLCEVTVLRNDVCDGLLIHCVPLAGIFKEGKNTDQSLGPITLTLPDDELELLMLAQRGMFETAMIQWSSLVGVAQWITSRLVIRRVFESLDNRLAGGNTMQRNNSFLLNSPSVDNESVTSQLTHSIFSGDHPENTANLTQTLNTTQNRFLGGFQMLEVTLDRSIEVPPTILKLWRSRNVPRMVGLQSKMKLRQEANILEITVILEVPSRRAYRKLLSFEDTTGTNNRELLDFGDDMSELGVEDDIVDDHDGSNILVSMSYRLTLSEILVFGAIEAEQHKAVAASKNPSKAPADKTTPEDLLWNVLSRLKVSFKGNSKNPYSGNCPASVMSNWTIAYDRQLLREVKTIDDHVLMLSCSITGDELIITPKSVNSAATSGGVISENGAGAGKEVDRKIFKLSELHDLVSTEGLPFSILAPENRRALVGSVLDRLKVVTESSKHRLELNSYLETRMITIIRAPTSVEPMQEELGVVEINSQHSLSDLRVILKHELDDDMLPEVFRFLYKGAPCSLRQEALRKAWACLPAISLLSRSQAITDADADADFNNPDKTKKRQKGAVQNFQRIPAGQRRAQGRFVAIPVQTLAVIQEGSPHIFLRSPVTELPLEVGSIIRLGSATARDYVVIQITRKETDGEENLHYIRIDPIYDLLGEPDMSQPIQRALAFPVIGAGWYTNNGMREKLIDSTHGVSRGEYHLPKDWIPVLDNPTGSIQTSIALELPAIFSEKAREKIIFARLSEQEAKARLFSITENENGDPSTDNVTLEEPSISHHTPVTNPVVNPTVASGTIYARIYSDVWMWKLVNPLEDSRLKWRVMYDNGEVRFNYEHANSNEKMTLFRVSVLVSYLEVLITDSRLPTYHSQRVDEMANIRLDFFLQLVFDELTNWAPLYLKGVDRTKLFKLLKEVEAFPDISRSARLTQIEFIFTKIVSSDLGILQRYLTYAGMLRFFKELAIIRYPPRRKDPMLGGDEALEDGSVYSHLSGESKKKTAALRNAAANSKRPELRKQSTVSSLQKPTKSSNASPASSSSPTEDDPLQGIDPEELLLSLTKFVVNHLMLYPTWYEHVWKHAKSIALQKEAVNYCAATRLQSLVRMFLSSRRFHRTKRAFIIIQSHVRRRITAHQTNRLLVVAYEDWIFRLRYYAAAKMQSVVRRFLKRLFYARIKSQMCRQQVMILKARSLRKRNLKDSKHTSVLLYEGKKINGLMVILKVVRKDARNFTRDYGIVIRAYVPRSQQTFHFVVENDDYRQYMAQVLEIDVEDVMVGHLLDRKNIENFLAVRLIVQRPSNKSAPPFIVFSKHGLGQRGVHRITHAKRIGGELFICKIFETVDDLAVQCYHQTSSKIFVCHITMSEIRTWLADEEMILVNQKRVADQKAETEKSGEMVETSQEETTSLLLLPENRPALHFWILTQLTVDTRNHQFRLVFTYNLEKSRRKEMIIKIQRVWRRALVAPRIVKLMDSRYLLVKSSPALDAPQYYLSVRTGVSQWEKPSLLRHYELPTRPSRRWVPITVVDRVGTKYNQYVNPWTGAYSYLVADQAVVSIQRLARKFLGKTIGMPLAMFLRAGRLIKDARQKYYASGGTKLPPPPSPEESLELEANLQGKKLTATEQMRAREAMDATLAQQPYSICSNMLREASTARRKLSAEEGSETSNKRLAATINLALVAHVVYHDETFAKDLYAECVEISQVNPLVTRCYGIYLFTSCEPPLALNRQRALVLLADASRKDPEHNKFSTAYAVFQYAVLKEPQNFMALINLAVAQVLIYKELKTAEKLFRRALALTPFNERVMELWKYFQQQFPEKKLLYYSMSQVRKVRARLALKDGPPLRIVHGRPVIEDSSWAGWCYVEHDVYKVSTLYSNLAYWYNPADGTETLEEPNFAAEWEIRKARSQLATDKDGLQQYFDPLTSEYFQYHPLTNSYQG